MHDRGLARMSLGGASAKVAPMSDATSAAVEPAVWRIDADRSRLAFSVKHLMVATVRGRFTEFEGELRSAGGALSSAAGTVRAASIETGEPARDDRLRDASLLDVERHPLIRFAAERIEQRGERFRVDGELEIGEVARPLTLEGTLARGPAGDGASDELRLAARGELSRREFGLSWSEVLEASGAVVSDRVRIKLEIVARRDGDTEPAAAP